MTGQLGLFQNASKKVKRNLSRLVKVSILFFATVGAVSGAVIFFAPAKIPDLLAQMSALGKESEYALPDPGSVKPSDDADVKALKSFSKVFVNIAKKTRPALVYIRTKKKVDPSRAANPFGFPDQFFFPFGRQPGQGQQNRPRYEEGAGSGFIVDLSKGYVVTNNHVIDGAESITIATIDDKEYKGKVIGGHKDSDVAVVQFEDMNGVDKNALAQVVFGDSDRVEVGDWVVALGAPFQLPQTLTVGVVSALGRERIIGGQSPLEDFIQTDAAINPGNSGGPLLNLDGTVIGINTAISSMTGSYAGIGFAVPANIAHSIAERLINTGKVERGFIGIQGADASALSEELLAKIGLGANQKGALVYSVIPGSPGDKAGLLPYDVILSIDGSELKNFSQLRTKVAFMKPGTTIKLVVLRSKSKINLNLSIGNSDDFKQVAENENEALAQPQGEVAQKYGFSLRSLTSADRSAENIVAEKGVLVDNVNERGMAAGFGFRKGDVVLEINRSSVQKPEEVIENFQTAEKDGKELLILIERQRRTKLLIVSMR